jgi:hypothetical protein
MVKDRLVGETFRKPVAALAAALSSLALGGCYLGPGIRVNGSAQHSIGGCGADGYNKAWGQQGVASLPKLVATAQEDIVALQDRTLNVGGSIRLPSDAALALKATHTTLRLGFARDVSKTTFETKTSDFVTFSVNPKGAEVSPGAIACYTPNNDLYPNGTYGALQLDLQATASISNGVVDITGALQ